MSGRMFFGWHFNKPIQVEFLKFFPKMENAALGPFLWWSYSLAFSFHLGIPEFLAETTSFPKAIKGTIDNP